MKRIFWRCRNLKEMPNPFEDHDLPPIASFGDMDAATSRRIEELRSRLAPWPAAAMNRVDERRHNDEELEQFAGSWAQFRMKFHEARASGELQEAAVMGQRWVEAALLEFGDDREYWVACIELGAVEHQLGNFDRAMDIVDAVRTQIQDASDSELVEKISQLKSRTGGSPKIGAARSAEFHLPTVQNTDVADAARAILVLAQALVLGNRFRYGTGRRGGMPAGTTQSGDLADELRLRGRIILRQDDRILVLAARNDVIELSVGESASSMWPEYALEITRASTLLLRRESEDGIVKLRPEDIAGIVGGEGDCQFILTRRDED
jgi:hypothetical protein